MGRQSGAAQPAKNIIPSRTNYIADMFDPDAPDFKQIKTWFNSKPISIRQMHGKVLLIDFFTYSCVNCVNTLPTIKALHEKYRDRNLVVIGVQTPEFEFEKDDGNVRKALEKHGITYPVANDWTNETWKSYGGQYWPRRALVNARGKVVFQQVGEGGEHELELKIIELLHEAGDRGEFEIEKNRELTHEEKVRVADFLKKKTPEIYLGWERGQLGNGAACVPGSCSEFVDQAEHADHVAYLSGRWTQEKESVRKEGDEGGYLIVKYTARRVNAVMRPYLGKRHRVYVTLDGRPLDRTSAGRDVKIDKTGSFIQVDGPDMYELVETEAPGTHELRLESDSDDFCVYTLTFG